MAVTMRQMLEAGVHFGIKPVSGIQDGTVYLRPSQQDSYHQPGKNRHAVLADAENFVRKLSAKKGTILFVATKRQARDILQEEAVRAGSPFVNHRWLGGMLTNYKTVQQSSNACANWSR